MDAESPQSATAQTPRQKARTLEDILAEFGSIDQCIVDPLELEPRQPAQPLLPPTYLFSNLTPIRLLYLILYP
jgi:hypothetical protein